MSMPAVRVLAAVTLAMVAVPSTIAPREVRSFRWLPGLLATAVSSERSSEAAERLTSLIEPDAGCVPWDAQAIVADVAPAPGDETVLASAATGVIVVSAAGRVVASAPSTGCGGSADGIVALAAGDAWIGAPVIAVVSSAGGHRTAETTLTLYRVGRERLEPIFSGALELRDGVELWDGSAVLFPGVILHRPPIGPLLVRPLRSARPPAEPAR